MYLENHGGAIGSNLMYTDTFYVFPLGYTMLMLFIDMVVWMLLALWMDRIFSPGKYFLFPYDKISMHNLMLTLMRYCLREHKGYTINKLV